MDRSRYDEEIETINLAPPAPAIVWGALMAVALIGATATVMRSAGAPRERLVAAVEEKSLQTEVTKLAAERDDLAGRLASLERSFGQFKLASRAANAPETTGSVSRPAAQGASSGTVPYVVAPIGVTIGRDGSLDEIRRRWSTLANRYPQQFGKLVPRAQRMGSGAGQVELVAGPFATMADAERACAALADTGLACDTTSYAGDPIGRP